MQHPETRLALHHARAADLRAQASAHRLTTEARQPYDIRTRLGWTLIEVGLRLTAPRPVLNA
ncbi:hypothetical protein ACIBAG_22180 [Streptomyces sp. NPDC051243]|uniref:hypothetical protein n=1 Tax=Streptomyces sp. NPDC051243 TaxID=3365646 RepID=UPI00379E0849